MQTAVAVIPAGLLRRRSVALLALVWLTYWSSTDPCNMLVPTEGLSALLSAAVASVFFHQWESG